MAGVAGADRVSPAYLSAAHLEQMRLAVEAASAVKVQTQSSMTDFMQWMGKTLQTQEEATAQQPLLPPGMTLRLAAAGLSPMVPKSPNMPTGPPSAGRGGLRGASAAGLQPAPLSNAGPSRASDSTPRTTPRATEEKGESRQREQSQRRKGQKNQKSQKNRDNLRTYLEELRNEDPRCIFITRRINKLGFRSKAHLQRHYSKYGEVVNVLVAHSKVKPFRNSGSMPRTRPGNFGLVLMRTPEDVERILAEGPLQDVMGVEIQAVQFELVGEDKELEEKDQEDEEMETDPRAPENNAAADECNDSTSSGSSTSAADVGSKDPTWRQERCKAADLHSLTTTCGSSNDSNQKGSSDQSSQHSQGSQASSSSSSRHTPRRQDAARDQRGAPKPMAGQGCRASPPKLGGAPAAPADEGASPAGGEPLASEMQQLKDLLRQHAAAGCGGASNGVLFSAVLEMLAGIADVQQAAVTPKQSLHAAALAHWAQQNLKRLEDDCQQRIMEILGLQSRMTLVPHPAAAPRPGLAVPPIPEAPWLAPGLPSGLPPCEAAQRQQMPMPPWLGMQPPPAKPPMVPGTRPPAHPMMLPKVTAQAGGFSPPRNFAAAFNAPRPGVQRDDEHPVGASGTMMAASELKGSDVFGYGCPQPGNVQQEKERRKQWPRERAAGDREWKCDTLRSHLTELRTKDPACVFIARRINKLGFRSREILHQHFAQYGEVCRVYVAHSKVKPFRDSMGQLKTRPGGLGLIVMRQAASVAHILSFGEEQMVAGEQIRVQSFETPTQTADGMISGDTSAGTSTSTGSTASKSQRLRSDMGSGTYSPDKSEEGGSSEQMEKCDADVGSSGPESPDSAS